MMSKDPIAHDEVLYRRVPCNRRLIKKQPDGTFKISSQAFYESTQRPSVDRAKIHKNDPRLTLQSLGSEPGGVVSIVTHDVRATYLAQYDKDQQPIQTFEVDVESAPIINDPILPDNPAHAEIFTEPTCPRKAFGRLLERLALLANSRNWEILPPHE